jgi:hypothetical protein
MLRVKYAARGSSNYTNTWKKLINRGDVFEIVVRSAVCNDVPRTNLSINSTGSAMSNG